MRTLKIIMFCGLLIPQMYILVQSNQLTVEEKDLAKKQNVDYYYQELLLSIKKLPYCSLK